MTLIPTGRFVEKKELIPTGRFVQERPTPPKVPREEPKQKLDIPQLLKISLPMQYPQEFGRAYFPAEEKLWKEKVRPFVRKAGKIFPATSPARYLTEDIASGIAEFGKPSWIVGGGIVRQATKGLMVRLASSPKGRAFLQKELPTLTKGLLRKTQIGLPRDPLAIIRQRQLAQPQVLNPVQNITQALKSAKPIRKAQEVLYSAERAKRAGQVIQAGQAIPGEAGYFAQLKALKGQLPKVRYEGIRGKVTQTDIDALFNVVEGNPVLSTFEKVTTKAGLSKLLGAEGVSVPTEGELRLLSQVFPSDFIRTVISKRALTQKLFEAGAEVLNIPRAVMASTDMSAPFRQGAFLIGRPKQFIPAFFKQFKYFFSEKAYKGLLTDIKSRPTYPLMKRGKLPLTELGATLTGREEAFMSQLAEKIPIAGKVIRASNRAYTGFLNKLRADVFDDLVLKAQKLGLKPEGKLLTDIGRFVGTATGRGSLGALERSAVTLNTFFFSPRLLASRLNLMNPAFYVKLDPFVRKEALKSLLTFAGAATSIISLAKMGGAKVGDDPRSADFAKIKVDNTRYDVWAGFQQYLRLAAQLITGVHISSTTGVMTTIGEGYKPLTRTGILGRFIETKASPVTTFAIGLLRGTSVIGKDFDVSKEIAQRFTPMVIQDMYDLYKERGLEGVMMAIPAIFGTGLQTYKPSPTEVVYSANSVIKHSTELMNQGRIEEAKKLYLRNKKLISDAEKLEPLQKELSEHERTRDRILKNVTIPPELRKKAIEHHEEEIEKIGTMMENRYKELQ